MRESQKKHLLKRKLKSEANEEEKEEMGYATKEEI